jgi:hypothetical protein
LAPQTQHNIVKKVHFCPASALQAGQKATQKIIINNNNNNNNNNIDDKDDKKHWQVKSQWTILLQY